MVDDSELYKLRYAKSNEMNNIMRPGERTAVFIDGANLYATVRNLNFDMDYKKLLTTFQENCSLVRIFYYTAIIETAEGVRNPLTPLVDWLDYNGYHMVTKPAKVMWDSIAGKEKIKGNMDIEIAIDAMEMAQIANPISHFVFFTGDGDFRSLVEAIQRKGIRVTVISSKNTRPSMIANELRKQADTFVELEDIIGLIGRVHNQEAVQRQEENI